MDSFAIYAFRFGYLKIGCENDRIVSIEKTQQTQDLGRRTKLTDEAYRQIGEYLEGKRREFSFPYFLQGTDFQNKVWNALKKIPYGETRSYKEIAAAIGRPGACRAVGGVNHKNPLMIVIPCHRVIGANGQPVGYGGGLAMKTALLELEKSNLEA